MPGSHAPPLAPHEVRFAAECGRNRCRRCGNTQVQARLDGRYLVLEHECPELAGHVLQEEGVALCGPCASLVRDLVTNGPWIERYQATLAEALLAVAEQGGRLHETLRSLAAGT